MIYKGGALVGQGTYWDIQQGERIAFTTTAILPGTDKRFYIKAPNAMMAVAAPVAGLVFAIFLPIIGPALAMWLFVRRMLGAAGGAAAKHVPFRWKPLEANFSGRKKVGDAPKTYANVDEILEALNSRKRK